MSLMMAALASTWTLSEYKDPINDREQFTASIEYQGIGLRIICVPRQGRSRAKSYAQVFTTRHLGFDGWAEVHYRFDAGKPVFELWNFEGKAVETEAPDDFVQGVRIARKLSFRIIDFERQPYDLTFTLPADFSVVDSVYSRCK